MTKGISISISTPYLPLSHRLKEMCSPLRKNKSCLLVRVQLGDRNHINPFEQSNFFQFY